MQTMDLLLAFLGSSLDSSVLSRMGSISAVTLTWLPLLNRLLGFKKKLKPLFLSFSAQHLLENCNTVYVF